MKLNIILDLDHTLISAEPTEEYNFKKNVNKAKKFVFYNMENLYIVFERPGLQRFLSYLFENFNVSVWTAASQGYAMFVIEKIIMAGNANRKIDYIFFSYHCNIAKKIKKGLKELSMLWDIYQLSGYKPDNTIILDDNTDEVCDRQPKNCIYFPPFEFTDRASDKDTFLIKAENQLRLLNDKFQGGTSVQDMIPEINKKLTAK